jgi:hypothetical protein
VKGGRQKQLLILLGLLVVALVVRYGVLSAQKPANDPAARVRNLSVESRAGKVATLELASLDAPASSYSPGRDPWRFFDPPPPPPPPPRQPSKEELERLRLAAEEAARLAAARARVAAEEARRPKPPQVTFGYLGSFGPAARRIAVLSDGANIWNAREGDIVEGKFEVAKIGLESVDIKFVGFPDTPPLRLAVGK